MSYNADRLRYTINHIFLPYKLPQESDSAGEKDHIISKIVFDAIKAFRGQLQTDETLKWAAVIQMVRTFRDTQKLDTINASDVKGAFNDFHTGRIFALYVRAQNAGVILRRPSSEHFTFEAFEVSPPSADVINTTGRLICSYPGPAVQFGSAVFESSDFKNELANFLVQMNNESFVEDSEEDRSRRTSSGVEIGDTPDPKYITSLLTGILRGLEEGEPADVERITKHVRDEAICRGKEAPWRRSGAWHVLKIAIQTTLMQHDPSHVWYKSFMAYLHAFVLNLALDLKHDQSLGSDILQNMRVKAGRRLAKLLQSHTVNDFVRDYVLGACDRAQRELQRRWEGIQALDITPPSVVEEPWAPMALQVELDTIMRLNNSFMYITTALSPDAPQPTDLPAFTPSEQPRLRDVAHFGQATIAKLQEGYLKEPLVALADFEWLVARGSLDSWLSDVQEGDVSDGYYAGNPEEQSIMVLTMLELWVAMDKLACTAYPLMKSYSPEVPLGKFYSRLLLGKPSTWSVSEKSTYTSGSDTKMGRMEMKQLRTTIENDAQAQRDRTIQEYNQKKAEYKRLVERTNAVDHRHIEDEAEWGWTGKGNKKKRQRVILRYPECPKCQLEVRRDGIKVTKA
ncbi:hypothetical protein VNI00_015173 [Paramarasmius palmivorus]|uniref:DUF6606 domain-containing protein n=1 Tax=Paramarasmius palmivorus TaxID=297713 RepID=A0AAW0BNG8_9AGAR